MLYWTLIFLVVAIVAGVLGFGGIASAASDLPGPVPRLAGCRTRLRRLNPACRCRRAPVPHCPLRDRRLPL